MNNDPHPLHQKQRAPKVMHRNARLNNLNANLFFIDNLYPLFWKIFLISFENTLQTITYNLFITKENKRRTHLS